MRTRSVLVGSVLGLTVAMSATSVAATPIYQDPSYSFAERAADLVSRMTLAEKASQMVSSQAPAVPRLGISAYGWGEEARHGGPRVPTKPGGHPAALTKT